MGFSFSLLGYRFDVALSNPPTWQFLDVHIQVVQKPVVVGVTVNVVGIQAAVSISKDLG